MMWPKATLAELMEDRVIYRNLDPLSPELPTLRDIWDQVGMDHYYIPRKTTPEYAAAMVHYLGLAQRQRGVTAPLERVLFVGDTLMNDGTAARNIGRHLAMRCFIGAERLQQPTQIETQGDVMVANRWQALADFAAWTAEEGFPCDERTALLLDLDKTSLGARGRNDGVIDAARLEAMRLVLRGALGDGYDEPSFCNTYNPLNQPEYHTFTADNQDYLAYICLMVSAGICSAEEFWRDLRSGTLATIADLVQRCDARRARMPGALVTIHDDVQRAMAAEDPTPFKEFRRKEYLETVRRMDMLPGAPSPQDVLACEIVMTAEVASFAREMLSRGALVFGLSDKPDEASLPTDELAAEGFQPLHRTALKVYGTSIN